MTRAQDFVEGGLSFMLGNTVGVLNSQVVQYLANQLFTDVSSLGSKLDPTQLAAGTNTTAWLITAVLEGGLLFTILGMINPKLSAQHAFFFTVGCLDASTISILIGQGLGNMVWSKV